MTTVAHTLAAGSRIPMDSQMKKMLIAIAVVGWILLPFFLSSAFTETKSHLDNSSLTLVEVCKTHIPAMEMDDEPWFSCIKGCSGGFMYQIRNKYFLPVGLAWLAIGIGLGAALLQSKKVPATP